jgi:hypothetical protein
MLCDTSILAIDADLNKPRSPLVKSHDIDGPKFWKFQLARSKSPEFVRVEKAHGIGSGSATAVCRTSHCPEKRQMKVHVLEKKDSNCPRFPHSRHSEIAQATRL